MPGHRASGDQGGNTGGGDQDYGGKCYAYLGKCDPISLTLKTAQCSLFEDSTESYAILPRSGTMRNGELWGAPEWEVCILESEPGLSLPTIGAQEGRGTSRKRYRGSEHFRGAKMCEGLRICETDPQYLNPVFGELAMMWPMGWTDLKPLETDKFRVWRQQHSWKDADD